MGDFLVGFDPSHALSLPGLPGNHHFRKSLREDGWIRGSSPRMTMRRELPRSVLASEREFALFFVLSKTLGIMLLPTNLPDRRRAASARSCWRRDWRGSAAGCWSPRSCCSRSADFRRSVTGCSIRWKQRFPRLGCRAGRARRHRRARRTDRPRSVGRPWHAPSSARAADRLIAAAALAHRYPNARIVYYRRQRAIDLDDDAREADYAAERVREPRHFQVAADAWSGAHAIPRKTPNSPRRLPRRKPASAGCW